MQHLFSRLWPLPQQAIWFIYLHLFIVLTYVVYGQGHLPRHPVAVREQPKGSPSLSTMWVLDTELGHPGWPVVFKPRKKKHDPQNTEILTINELYFPTPKFELWFDNFVVLICEFIKFLCQVWRYMPVIPALGR